MVGPEPLGDEPRESSLVEVALVEPDRERAHLARGLRGERGQRARVDPAGEEDADGHVGDEMSPNRVAQPLAQLLGELVLAFGSDLALRHGAWSRVALDRDVRALPGLPDEHAPGRQLAYVAEDRQRRRHEAEREERLERVLVDLAGEVRLAHQRLQLGREGERVSGQPVVERLDAETVAREDEALSPRVPDRDREHPPETLREKRPVLLVEVREDLRVALRAEGMALVDELGTQLAVVVDLAVLHDGDRAVLVRQRLVARLQVDDRQAPRGEPGPVVDEHAVAVRALGGRAPRSSPRARRGRRRRRSRETRPQIPHMLRV